MTDEARQVVLDAHNRYRSIVARGQAANKNGTKLPTATNMYKMTYSKLVESYAQQVANTCVWKHVGNNGTSNNMYRSGGYGYETVVSALNSSVTAYYNELPNDGQDSLSGLRSHFTQVAWWNSKEIGCAVAQCPGNINLKNYYINSSL
jgi:hypothetical protein